MAEVSKQVANWTLVTRTVSSALEQHGPALAGALEEALFPEGAPPELTLVGLLEAMRGALQRRLAEAQEEVLNPLSMTAKTVDGKLHKALAINEVSLLRAGPQAAKLS